MFIQCQYQHVSVVATLSYCGKTHQKDRLHRCPHGAVHFWRVHTKENIIKYVAMCNEHNAQQEHVKFIPIDVRRSRSFQEISAEDFLVESVLNA